MKTNYILIVLVTLSAGDGCKNQKQVYKPVEQKKSTAVTVRKMEGSYEKPVVFADFNDKVL